ncbi:EamA family transporter [Limosilactobacillus sp. RRLNB_1_1]|uniref:EamA family transporter n=1 Tax=Limosilactobacillus albertensis TaxID=2759752 RepID=A0A7W3Y8I6_9LACO|nr:DMT family transporter [Limosilactobacillus albertensis]MBB1069764.1 EamA family transporter [Limosilactobacillus albertensis]MCD7117642.1 DMT family transporter [Limosilactobacillus albertensis]MCD7129565.1 DMT family transporter [Limosilactobacillus albertensis]
MEKSSSQVMKGIIWAAVASAMWGISGTVLQLISQNLAIPATWMLSMRTFSAGIILLIISVILYGKRIFNVFKTRATAISVISYAILGLMANLLTFYYAIQTGNASAATILQYLSPLFIVLGGIIFMHRRPFRSDIIAFVIALIGVALCITRGNFTQLALPLVSLLWGLGSGITAAFYVVLPQRAADENPPIVVLGWGTMIAGILFNLYRPFWVNPPHVSTTLVASVATVVLFGTILPFGILLHATRYAPSDVVSIMDAVQPITTSILSVIFFHLNLNWAEILGIVLVIIAVYILQNGRRKHTIHY